MLSKRKQIKLIGLLAIVAIVAIYWYYADRRTSPLEEAAKAVNINVNSAPPEVNAPQTLAPGPTNINSITH